jgi:rSAM/selenodomain-associated transferase 1
MAKAPLPGMVKTRLVPPLTAEQAAQLYHALLLDQLEQLSSLAQFEKYLAYAPDGGETDWRALAGAEFRYLPQRGADLGARMENLCVDLSQLGHRNIVLIGSDLPGLPMNFVRDAFQRLARDRARVVLGPSRDGGYYLIGMNQPTPALFANMTWSHERVLADTKARLDAFGLPYSLLPEWFDIDRAGDLERLASGLEPETRARLRRTLAYLQTLKLAAASRG